MSAPACPISRNQALPGMPGRQLPVPPRAMDLPSLIAAVNALRDLVLAMYGPGTGLNNAPGAGYAAPRQGSATVDAGKPMVVVKNDWKEIRRYDEQLRVYHNHSNVVAALGEVQKGAVTGTTNYVDVTRIHKLVFHWEHNDVFMPEDAFEWAYRMEDYMPDIWSMVANGYAAPFGQGPGNVTV